jgi:hypothetical protein
MTKSTVDARSGADKAEQWRDRFKRFAVAEQTVASFCVSEAVSEANFYWWRKKLQAPVGMRRTQPRRLPAQFIDAGHATLMANEGGRGTSGRVQLRIDLGDGLVITVARH